MTDYSGYTTEELENLYKGLLKERITDLRQGTNAVSRLEGQRPQVSMAAARKDLTEFREDFTVAQKRKYGNELFTGNRSYEEVLCAMVKGEYRR